MDTAEAAVNDLARYAQPAASPPVSCALSLSLLLSGLRPSAASARPFREASGRLPGGFREIARKVPGYLPDQMCCVQVPQDTYKPQQPYTLPAESVE